MVCKACGYEHKGEWAKDGYNNIVGDQQFINVMSEHKFKIDNPREREYGDYDYQEYINVELYACPKCHTVLMDIIE